MALELTTRVQDFLGRGLITPILRRAGVDFLSASGIPLVRSAIRQILGTRRGELRWNPSFGLVVDRQRNRINNEELEALVKGDIQNAVRTFEPRVDALRISIRRSGNSLTASVNWSIIERNVPGNQVLLGPDTFDVRL